MRAAAATTAFRSHQSHTHMYRRLDHSASLSDRVEVEPIDCRRTVRALFPMYIRVRASSRVPRTCAAPSHFCASSYSATVSVSVSVSVSRNAATRSPSPRSRSTRTRRLTIYPPHPLSTHRFVLLFRKYVLHMYERVRSTYAASPNI